MAIACRAAVRALISVTLVVRDSSTARRTSMSMPTCTMLFRRVSANGTQRARLFLDALLSSTQDECEGEQSRNSSGMRSSNNSGNASAKEGAVWHAFARKIALGSLDALHNDIDGVSLALEEWYHFEMDGFTANSILAGRKFGSFLVRRLAQRGGAVVTLTAAKLFWF